MMRTIVAAALAFAGIAQQSGPSVVLENPTTAVTRLHYPAGVKEPIHTHPFPIVVVQVTPGGPAAKAGLQPFRRAESGGVVQGDVITAINDEPVANLDDLLTQLERHSPNDSVTLTLWRDGKTRKQSVTLAPSQS